jgi:hypothetical protein
MYTDGRESAEVTWCVCVCMSVRVVCRQNCCRLSPIGSASSSSLAAILTCVFSLSLSLSLARARGGMYKDGREYLQVSFPRRPPLISFSEMVDY